MRKRQINKRPRVRCPFCQYLYDKGTMRGHIIEQHFPTHCTVCDRTPNSHETMKSSPTYTIPCDGGTFEPGDVRR